MELFDTHAHFEGTREETAAALERALAAGVARVMAVGGSEELNRGVARAAEAAPAGMKVYRAFGYDRDQAGCGDLEPIDYSGVAAVGEIGLDYHYSPETRRAQIELFSRQVEKARALGLPIVVHTREADDDTLGVLREIPARGIIHSFTGSVPFARKLLDLGYHISFSGIVTFKSAENVRESARYVPLDRMLVETDSPFLAPVPVRGNPCEPAFVRHTARFLAELRQMNADVFAALATANAIELLG